MRTNRLAGEKSPYLLQHKDNPVAWWPWGGEAFAAAKAAGKPVFLSIGYSTCHWCHVMAHESFEDERTAQILNEHFLPIKVDREERPDVDRVFMAYVQATSGGGGWPMSVWLTPEGEPFFGGTYFPPDDAHGRPGFASLLRKLADLWTNERARVSEAAAQGLEVLKMETDPGTGIQKSWLTSAREAFEKSYDEEWGGFGRSPKFPRPSVMTFLLRSGGEAMAVGTLQAMGHGGIHDHLGGGFHRYSVDRYWHVPHFEKMLYDQAQVAVSYMEAWQVTGEEEMRETAIRVLEYVLRDLRHPEGGFFSAEDADSLVEAGRPESAEGAYYTWRQEELAHVLTPDEFRVFCIHFGVEPNGNVPAESDPHGEFSGRNILIQRWGEEVTGETSGLPVEVVRSLLSSAKSKLLEIRLMRPRPHLDDKVLAAWNGLMISALARAGAVFGCERYLVAASETARFVLDRMASEGRLLRSWRAGEPASIGGFAEDYALMIQALLDLYGADFDVWWLSEARRLQELQDQLFWDAAGGSYFSSEAGDPLLPVRMKDDYDGAEPSANSISALNLLRLARLMHDQGAESKALKILSAHGGALQFAPGSVPQMLVALDFAVTPPSHAIVVGSSVVGSDLLKRLHQTFRPRAVTVVIEGGTIPAEFSGWGETLASLKAVDGLPTLYQCENFTCQAPVTC